MWKIILKYPGTFQYTFCRAHYETPKTGEILSFQIALAAARANNQHYNGTMVTIIQMVIALHTQENYPTNLPQYGSVCRNWVDYGLL